MNSKTLDKMIDENKGYRTETFSGSGVKDLKDILYYEITELGNTDILDYMKKNYRILKDFEIDKSILKDLKQNAENEEELKEWIIEEEQLIAITNSTDFIDEIYSFLSDILKSDNLNGIWLTTYEQVKEIYNGEEYNIDEYILPNKYIIISDLGVDGSLFVYINE